MSRSWFPIPWTRSDYEEEERYRKASHDRRHTYKEDALDIPPDIDEFDGKTINYYAGLGITFLTDEPKEIILGQKGPKRKYKKRRKKSVTEEKEKKTETEEKDVEQKTLDDNQK